MEGQFFAERYKLLSNEELMDILDQQEDYLPEAIQAAKQEFENRQLSSLEIDQLKINTLSTHLLRLEKNEQPLDKRFFAGLTMLINALNPFNKNAVERGIAMVILAANIYLVIDFFLLWNTLKYLFVHYHSFANSSFIMLARFIMIPAACVWCYKKQRPGWIILCAYFTYVSMGTFILVTGYFANKYFYVSSWFMLFNLLSFLFFAFILNQLNQTKMRNAFSISIPMQSLIIGLACIVRFAVSYLRL